MNSKMHFSVWWYIFVFTFLCTLQPSQPFSFFFNYWCQKTSFFSLMLALSWSTWNNNSPLPIHDDQQVKKITEHKAHTSVKLIHLLTSAISRRSPSHKKKNFPGSLLLTVLETEVLNTIHNYHMPAQMPIAYSHPPWWAERYKLLGCPCFKLSIISCNN